jgi:hemerythrin
MTEKILWSDAYLVGIEEIDIQHKYLCKFINLYVDKINGHLPEMDADELLDELVRYVRWHFNCEEKLMEIYDIADIDDHKEEHAALLRMIRDKRKLAEAEKGGHYVFLGFFDAWFAGHSFGFDKRLGQAMREKWNPPLHTRCGM